MTLGPGKRGIQYADHGPLRLKDDFSADGLQRDLIEHGLLQLLVVEQHPDELRRSFTMARYWISFDLGLQGNYEQLYAWLDQQDYKTKGDRQGAKECGDNLATFVSSKSRSAIAKELKSRLSGQRNARVYIITMESGGKFFIGTRKFAPWKGYAEVGSDVGEER